MERKTISIFSRLFLNFEVVFLILISAGLSFSGPHIVNGKVTSINGDIVKLDIGSKHGVREGDVGRIYYKVTLYGKEKPVYIAKFKITHLFENYAVAQIEEKEKDVMVGNLFEIVTKEKWRKPEPGQDFQEQITGMEFVFIKGGCFEMGEISGDETSKSVHEVCVRSFWVGKHEVTQWQWGKIMGSNPSIFKRGGNYPIENVSWYQVQEFIHRLNVETGQNYRLPTEAEWEYAARSGGKREKWAGTSNELDLMEYAWYRDNSSKSTHPVGQKRPNALGLFDMSGNVWEWCQDWYDKDYYIISPRDNPKGPSSGVGKVLRGGSWQWEARVITTSFRNWLV